MGFVLFILNRNKEFRIERAKLAGFIHLSIIDFKTAFSHYVRKSIHFNSNDRIYTIITDEAYILEMTDDEREIYNPQVSVELRNHFLKEMNEQREKLFQSKRKLTKLFGQYKFYLERSPRQRFIKAIEPFMNLKLPEYSFSEQNSDIQVGERRDKLIKELSDEMKTNYKPIFDKIENFLEASIEFPSID